MSSSVNNNNNNNNNNKKTRTGNGGGRGGGRASDKSGIKAKGIIISTDNDVVDVDYDDDIFLEMISSSSSSRRNRRQQQLILFFFLNAVVVIVSVIWKQQQQQTPFFPFSSSSSSTTTTTTPINTGTDSDIENNSIKATNSRRTSLSELFRIGCNNNKGTTKLGIYCDTQFFEIHDNDRSIRTKSQRRSQRSQGSSQQSNLEMIKAGMRLLEIPSTVQITTIDALRDIRVLNLIKQNPRHNNTTMLSKQALPPKAYLAVYIAFELDRVNDNRNDNSNIKLSKLVSPEKERLHRAYLKHLPTYQDFVSFHPILALSKSTTTTNTVSLTEHLVKKWFQHFLSEYTALYEASSSSSDTSTSGTTTSSASLFANHIAWEDYITARLIVNTRGFASSGPIPDHVISDEELELYRPYINDIPYGRSPISSSTTSYNGRTLFYENLRNSSMLKSCMVPLLDSFDHHSNPNVGWQSLERHQQSTAAGDGSASFVAYASKDIIHTQPGGTKLYDSYGSTLSDSWIYAQYGFVNKERSTGRRVATLLAPYHQLHEVDFFITEDDYADRSTSQLLHKYLAFEDGYESCTNSSENDDGHQQQQQYHLRIKFQQMKFNALKTISNSMKSWFASVPTTTTTATNMEDAITPEYLDDGIADVLSLCRMLATTHRDYNGHAIHNLMQVITTDNDGGNNPIHLLFPVSTDEHTTKALEYRTWHILERLAMAVEVDLRRKLLLQQQQQQHPRNGNGNEFDFVLLGESEAISILCKHAERWKQSLLLEKTKRNTISNVNEEDYIIRDKPCGVV
ncbi:hypothetical protein FRACYDRAFT_247483 [Fragilariopsis cylindrus CCMP1102]|uniref:SET domain-containing protein n=1 Tax=Fragilariopsis cylindrus CCMP1102 TaxID=635003 RepID=A0A1E7EX25_9STRA|nr:hypothetical protein FRACYDRAFT_247483 [Fragilariopsis cylindrus CCMP1102]|eukprot:OEU10406.1 hypothetical protein FRACYDRAFT_247483 [Fragilariopsis cylindrus CCMP1102]